MQGRKSCRNETKQRRSRKLYKEVKKKPKLKTLYYIKRLKSINRSWERRIKDETNNEHRNIINKMACD